MKSADCERTPNALLCVKAEAVNADEAAVRRRVIDENFIVALIFYPIDID